MKLRYILLLFSIIVISSQSLFAQENSAGRCYSNDYHLWNDNQKPDLYGDCGNSDVFNTGNELTLEVWVRAYGFGENRKIMGKKFEADLDHNGYVLGYENLHVYSEISNPERMEIAREGTGPMPADSAWIHIATTYKADGHMINYINGDTVGYMQVFPQNPVSESIGNFIIGRAPWDYAFLFYGDLDEVRVWNVQRSQEEIKENMFKHLNGDETGLVAYYNFNQPNGATFYDQSPNNNNGTINEFGHIAFEWANSYAPVGDELMNEMHNIQAAWCGKKQTAGFNLIDTLDGLSFITDIREKEFHKYLVAGHDNLSGTTQDSIPLEAPLDFKRLKRTWYVNQGGSFTTNLVFDLKKSAAYNDTLEAYHADSLYTLLKLNANGRYEPVYSANIAYFTPENYNLVFENVNLSDGFYTVGYGSERLAPSSSINEISAQKSEINIYPNPAREQLTIEHSEGGIFEIFDLSGKKQFEVNITSNSNTINIASLPNGIYIVKIKTKNETFTNKIIIQ